MNIISAGRMASIYGKGLPSKLTAQPRFKNFSSRQLVNDTNIQKSRAWPVLKSVALSVLQLPLTISQITLWAHSAVGMEKTGTDLGATKTPCGKCYVLYRAITPEELNIAFTSGKGALFERQDLDRPADGIDAFLHMTRTGYDEKRAYTSFSSVKALAYKFANQHGAYGAVAEWQIPVSLVTEHGKPGNGVFAELLLRTSDLDIKMIKTVEIRLGDEIKSATKAEQFLWAAADSPIPYLGTHDFKTPPAGVFDIQTDSDRLNGKRLLDQLESVPGG